MSELGHAKSFRDLTVYQKARAVVKQDLSEIGRMLRSMITKAGQFWTDN